MQTHANAEVFYVVGKTAAIFPYFQKSYSKEPQDDQLAFLHHHIKFHLDQMKSVWENEANRLGFALTLWPLGKVNVSDSGIKW